MQSCIFLIASADGCGHSVRGSAGSFQVLEFDIFSGIDHEGFGAKKSFLLQSAIMKMIGVDFSDGLDHFLFCVHHFPGIFWV